MVALYLGVMVQEKRKHPRYEMELPVTLRFKGRLIPASSVDVSRGGLCVLTDYNAQIENGEAEVTIDLNPKFQDVALTGEVIRFEKGIGQRVAVQFKSFSSKGYKTLEKFLQQYTK